MKGERAVAGADPIHIVRTLCSHHSRAVTRIDFEQILTVGIWRSTVRAYPGSVGRDASEAVGLMIGRQMSLVLAEREDFLCKTLPPIWNATYGQLCRGPLAICQMKINCNINCIFHALLVRVYAMVIVATIPSIKR